MPELPEVETIVRGLRAAVVGRRIVGVTFGKTDFMDDPAAIERNVPGRRIEGVERYGKFMVLRLSETNGHGSAAGLLVHLGMTGRLMAAASERPQEKHTHACFRLDDGRELRYTDARRFGRMAFFPEAALAEELSPLGADPLEVTVEDFCDRLLLRRARIKALLLDQHVLRGVGNIYADESLWRAKIHPARLGARLSRAQAAGLHRALQKILRRAIALRGSSISDFVDADGRPGDYQRRHRAYGREGKPCARCGTRIRRMLVADRGSYFCPRCQRAPRGRGETRRGKRGV
jgi:formamidopyrimidine-DNA glycosylase